MANMPTNHFFLLQRLPQVQPFVTSVIIGATTMEQLKTDIESVNVNLSDEVIKEINEIQKIYPNPCP